MLVTKGGAPFVTPYWYTNELAFEIGERYVNVAIIGTNIPINVINSIFNLFIISFLLSLLI